MFLTLETARGMLKSLPPCSLKPHGAGPLRVTVYMFIAFRKREKKKEMFKLGRKPGKGLQGLAAGCLFLFPAKKHTHSMKEMIFKSPSFTASAVQKEQPCERKASNTSFGANNHLAVEIRLIILQVCTEQREQSKTVHLRTWRFRSGCSLTPRVNRFQAGPRLTSGKTFMQIPS